MAGPAAGSQWSEEDSDPIPAIVASVDGIHPRVRCATGEIIPPDNRRRRTNPAEIDGSPRRRLLLVPGA
jgi:hypothetical protein